MADDATVLSCDWGTTNVRLRRVEIETGRILAEAAGDRGVKRVHSSWRAAGGDRKAQYLEALGVLVDGIGRRVSDRAVVVSGMATSSIGIVELPYAGVPFRLDGSDLRYDVIEHSTLDLPVLMLSGVRTADDVMRGEETELIGLHHRLDGAAAPSIYILPGTHCKHVYVEGDAMRGFRTFMTGEVFEVMREASILRGSVGGGGFDREAFALGVEAARERPLLTTLFQVRTNVLFERLTPEANASYLSGALVGSELNEGLGGRAEGLVLCAKSSMEPAYRAALEVLGLADRTRFEDAAVVDRAAVDGHLAAYRRFLERGSYAD